MQPRPKYVRSIPAALALLALAGSATANTVSSTATIPLENTNWSHIASVPRFNTALGTLEEVRVSMTGHIEGTARYENVDTSPSTITLDFNASLKVKRPDNNAVLLSSTPSFHRVDSVGAFDGVLDFGGTSGATYSAISTNATSDFVPTMPLVPADLALFVGAGNVVFTITADGHTAAAGSGNLISGFTQRASAVLTVTYTYTPPFIQDCNGNGILDSIDIANHTSPDCNHNGIPDSCELLGNDCNDNHIPDECDLAAGTMTDLDGDGLPDQCNCVRVNRRVPASLLLYPEFDNRPGQVTLVTVTNTNRNYINGFVRVEFRYIDGTTCLETNRTENLSPNDTLTVITRTHQGGQNRGYVYAFACDLQGAAITFNNLIGDEIVLDGIEALDYGMEAFTWRGVPPQRQVTDLDGDGIRDLNGLEYEPSPDVILVPRFLGQDSTTHGQLIFVNLSGGAAFTTTIDLQIFNDNEDPFSAQYTFHCWAKTPLLAINGMFSNSMLHASDDAPDEVLGNPSMEAGWMRLDGNVAISSAAVIQDPAFLAVLIENRGAFQTADLPFELCTQTNGDLLPLGPLGDTSP
jgi:hypothetical protein